MTSPLRRVYLDPVRRRVHLGRWRPDPVRFDIGLALVLFVAAELEIWLTDDANRPPAPSPRSVAPVLAASVAVRRLYPLLAGVAAQSTVAITFAGWSDTEIFGSTIAWFCALYAMTVWTSPRRFAVGAASCSSASRRDRRAERDAAQERCPSPSSRSS